MNLKSMQGLSPEAHGALDYLTGALLLAAPHLFKFNRLRGPSVQLARTAGALVLGQAALTQYKLGLLRVLPLRMHLALDYALGPFLAASPFLFGFNRRRKRAWLPHMIAGLGVLLNAAMTRPREDWEEDEDWAAYAEERVPAERKGEADWEMAVKAR